MKPKKETPASQQGESVERNKDTQYLGQIQRVYLAFRERPKTMLEVSQETGILRANICRYISKMRKHDQVTVVKNGWCPITHFKAGFFTTDPALFPAMPIQQQSLFNDGGLRHE